jgi:hypothetical protein
VLRALAAGLATLLLAVATGCDSGDDGAAAPPSQGPAQEPPVRPATLIDHLRALQRIADENGGNRSAGTGGDRASVDYVVARLRGAGWNVRTQDVSFPFYRERSAQVTVAHASGSPSGGLRSSACWARAATCARWTTASGAG